MLHDHANHVSSATPASTPNGWHRGFADPVVDANDVLCRKVACICTSDMRAETSFLPRERDFAVADLLRDVHQQNLTCTIPGYTRVSP